MKNAFALFSAVLALAAPAATVTDVYTFTMSILVPRIYANDASLGYRKYQRQHLVGEMSITYDGNGEARPSVAVKSLVNRTQKVGGAPISYSCTVGNDGVTTRVNLLGNNRTEKFEKPSIVFYMDAEPSYSIGPDDEDNSLLVILSGYGLTVNKSGLRIIRRLSGNVAGTLGCGCRAYGHVSPTRVAGSDGATDDVDDVASVFGTWSAKWKRRDKK